MLKRLKKEVLDQDVGACLPARLTDEWLLILSRSADTMLGNASDGGSISGAACMAVILRLLDATTNHDGARMEVSHEAMREYFVRYRMELALQEVARFSDIRYEPATLETVLTEREVVTWRQQQI
jgi:hypothetical protein